MGWKSTIDITRADAIELIKSMTESVDKFTDEQLANLVEELMGGEEHGHNYRIVRTYSGDFTQKWKQSG